MTSDHSPIAFNMQLSENQTLDNIDSKSRLNFAKVNWPLFRKIIDDNAKNLSISIMDSLNINELNDLIFQ